METPVETDGMESEVDRGTPESIRSRVSAMGIDRTTGSPAANWNKSENGLAAKGESVEKTETVSARNEATLRGPVIQTEQFTDPGDNRTDKVASRWAKASNAPHRNQQRTVMPEVTSRLTDPRTRAYADQGRMGQVPDKIESPVRVENLTGGHRSTPASPDTASTVRQTDGRHTVEEVERQRQAGNGDASDPKVDSENGIKPKPRPHHRFPFVLKQTVGPVPERSASHSLRMNFVGPAETRTNPEQASSGRATTPASGVRSGKAPVSGVRTATAVPGNQVVTQSNSPTTMAGHPGDEQISGVSTRLPMWSLFTGTPEWIGRLSSAMKMHFGVSQLVLIERIAQIVTRSTPVSQTRADWVLNGGNLGPLRVQYSQDAAGDRVVIVVNSETTRQVVQNFLPVIQEGLNQKGIALSVLTVQVQGEGQAAYTDGRRRHYPEGMGMTSLKPLHEEQEEADPGVRDFGYNTMEVLA
jgi:hypothetical protein